MPADDRPARGEQSSPQADAHDVIRVRGARENNLRGVDVDLPKRRLTVFTGVSGSGKSSLVFGTVAAESRRLIDETYSTFVQGFMPSLPRPDVDELDGLTAAILVGQERMGANARSTLGTVTDANAMLRTLFSRVATPRIGGASAYAFNLPATTVGAGTGGDGESAVTYLGGMCPQCEGLGTVSDIDPAAIVDASRYADWIIDMGPGAGHDGGRIVFQGTPADLVHSRATLTGQHLATYVGAS